MEQATTYRHGHVGRDSEIINKKISIHYKQPHHLPAFNESRYKINIFIPTHQNKKEEQKIRSQTNHKSRNRQQEAEYRKVTHNGQEQPRDQRICQREGQRVR